MASHDNRDWPGSAEMKSAFESLQKRADQMTADGTNTITVGKPDEKPIKGWIHDGTHVNKMPDDPDGVLRVSIGGYGKQADYLTYRGKKGDCIAIMEKALAALTAKN